MAGRFQAATPRGPRQHEARANSKDRSHFTGDGISADISVGHDAGSDAPLTGTSGKTYELDCGTTSTQPVPGVFAKCTVNGEKPVINAYNATYVLVVHVPYRHPVNHILRLTLLPHISFITCAIP